MRVSLLALAAAASLPSTAAHGSNWDPKFYAQARATLALMTPAQKLTMVHGAGGSYVGNTPSITLSDGTVIPPLNLEDGPQGVADGVGGVTAWPSALTVVQTWDPELMYQYGAAMGREQWLKGTNVMLGPGVNLARVPWCGRNFEYQGEDPVLAAKMVAAEVKGIQSQNVSACVKHYVFNSQESDRSGMSSNVPLRAAKELYYKPFAAAVDAGVGSAMCSYNRVNGTWACENAATISELKDGMNFSGFLMSDWGATHSTTPSALAGLDQQMPDDSFFGAALAAAVASGAVPQSRIDDMVLRMLTPMYALNLFADPPTPARNTSAPAQPAQHAELARTLALASITLLKNSGGLLPVNPASLASVLVLGDTDTVHGDGSGGVRTPYVITPEQGIRALLNTGAWAQPTAPPPGVCSSEDGWDYYQSGSPQTTAGSLQECCNACAATPGCNSWTWDKGTSCWLKPNADGRRANSAVVSGNVTARPPPPPPAPGAVNVTYLATQDAAAAAAACAGVDLCVMVAGTKSSEGSDRGDLALPAWQDAMAAALVAAAPGKTVIVARCPGACFMPWRDAAQAILYELMPGQESGNSLAATLFGWNNPSGRLPVSFPAAMNDTWLGSNPAQYPGTDRGRGFPEVDYSEELLMGYRFYDATGTQPLWAFGEGGSYTSFSYSGLTVSGAVTPTSAATVYATVCWAGGPPGAEVAQLYIGYPAAAAEPPKLLKGFQKVALVDSAGSCAGVAFPLSAEDLSVWDSSAMAWRLVPGTYQVMVGSTSADIRLRGTLTV